MVAEGFWLEQLRPKEVVNEFVSVKTRKDGRVEVLNDRYKTKIRRSENQVRHYVYLPYRRPVLKRPPCSDRLSS